MGEVTGQGVVTEASEAPVSGSEVTGQGVVTEASEAPVSGSEVTGQGVVVSISGSEVTGHGVVSVSGNDVTGQGVSGSEVTGQGVSGSEVTGHGVVALVSGRLVTGHGVVAFDELLPVQPTDGNTHPHVLPFTMLHSAFSCATHWDPSYDGRYEWQSAVATSPLSGQAVPAGASPAPEQMAPRESASL
ncbi:uncharacterized protein PITG_06228 [Phytophthora infestans T30-4]|uniref:Uncharacterized protein n=1 Tax=Phytophthora infestans (strain T30-4) TaxID=403677 RepID=D0N4D4_PHYIT|nr:uncharacterized protein PITG_06228 [Phytophthora infestans T30-4]EEY69742.1 hypothetical protein PITG_06228 [Phytophthora infestans T30-4]|eukprot:XP_002998389.1 hypothetical protein PITG_06228 [Phytophthora infestans T30-4]